MIFIYLTKMNHFFFFNSFISNDFFFQFKTLQQIVGVQREMLK